MPQYLSLLPLLSNQSYIDNAFVNDAWLCSGSPCGDQPWEPQNEIELQKEYDQVYHLTYRTHPGMPYIGKSCVDFIAAQQGYTLEEPVCPFIEVASKPDECVAYATNPDYFEEKQRFRDIFTSSVHIPVVDVAKLPWHAAAEVINSAIAYIGDRSANWVIANGVAQKNIFIYEPNTSRNQFAFHNVFGNPHWREAFAGPSFTPGESADFAVEWISLLKENSYVTHVSS